jgi:hypothetical protein
MYSRLGPQFVPDFAVLIWDERWCDGGVLLFVVTRKKASSHVGKGRADTPRCWRFELFELFGGVAQSSLNGSSVVWLGPVLYCSTP